MLLLLLVLLTVVIMKPRLYRQFRGGYWVYEHFVGWRRVPEHVWYSKKEERLYGPDWSFEHHG